VPRILHESGLAVLVGLGQPDSGAVRPASVCDKSCRHIARGNVEGGTVGSDRCDIGGEVVSLTLISNGETQSPCRGCLAGEVWHEPAAATLAFREVVDIDNLFFVSTTEPVYGLDCFAADWCPCGIGDDLKLEPSDSCNDATCDVSVALGSGSLKADIAVGDIPRGQRPCRGA